MTQSIKNCPFCNYPAMILERATKNFCESVDKFFTHGYQIRCVNALCGCLTRQDGVLEDLVAIWNKRHEQN